MRITVDFFAGTAQLSVIFSMFPGIKHAQAPGVAPQAGAGINHHPLISS